MFSKFSGSRYSGGKKSHKKNDFRITPPPICSCSAGFHPKTHTYNTNSPTRAKEKGQQEKLLVGGGGGEPQENEASRRRTRRFLPSQESSQPIIFSSSVPPAHQRDIVNRAPSLSMSYPGKFYSDGA